MCGGPADGAGVPVLPHPIKVGRRSYFLEGVMWGGAR